MIEDIRPFSSILALPLFQGLNRNDLAEVVAQTKFAFSKTLSGYYITEKGKDCRELKFILSGNAECISSSDDKEYCIHETIEVPELIEPERLFGLDQKYTRSIKAISNCNIMEINKSEVLKLSDKFKIFRMNLLNIVSTKAQKGTKSLWISPASSLEQNIAAFIAERCIYPKGQKTIDIKMKRLAEELNDSRLDVSRALKNIQAKGLVSLSRGKIMVPDLEKLTHQL